MKTEALRAFEPGGTWNLWSSLSTFGHNFTGAIGKILRSIKIQKKARTLHLAETLPLGEKRFVAVVEWHKEKFLLGITPHTITLLEKPTKGALSDSIRTEEVLS